MMSYKKCIGCPFVKTSWSVTQPHDPKLYCVVTEEHINIKSCVKE